MDNIRMAFAVCRIVANRLVDRIRGKVPEQPKPIVHVVALGLTGSGKSTALALVTGESLSEVEPTKGFHIKDIKLSNCCLTVKELGGSEKIRKYWAHYYDDQDGVVCFVNGCGTQEELDSARVTLLEAIDHTKLVDLPVLVLVTHCDQANCMRPDQLYEEWKLEERYGLRVTMGSSSIQDTGTLSTALLSFSERVLQSTAPMQVDIEETKGGGDAK